MRSNPVKAACLAALVAMPSAAVQAQVQSPVRPGIHAADLERIAPTALSVPPASERPPGSLRRSTTVAPNLVITAQNVGRVNPVLLRSILDQSYLKAAGDAIAANLKNKSVGYAVAIVMPDGAMATRTGGSARRAPDVTPRAMLASDKITIASSSKTITAAALMHLMTAQNISAGATIGQYLPPYWKLGPHVSKITLGQLLTHTSGIRTCGIFYADLKSCLAGGVNLADQTYQYENTNFALFRVIIPRMRGVVSAPIDSFLAALEAASNTDTSASFYARSYMDYVNQVVFKPIGFPRMYCTPSGSSPALSYKGVPTNIYDFTTVGPGDVWGDMTLSCGSQGWQLSAIQLATFMHELQTGPKIVASSVADMMRTSQYGMYARTVTSPKYPKGLVYWHHNGYHPASMNGGEINTVMMYYANGVTVAAIINSPYAPDDNYYPALENAIASV
jgi:CubicO group peptidase (beta-lactamase class C family)